MRRRNTEQQFEDRAELEQALADARQTIELLRAELATLKAQTLQVARQFEHEAAARAETEAIMGVLGSEHAQLQAEADGLRARLGTAEQLASPSPTQEPVPDAQSENPAAE